MQEQKLGIRQRWNQRLRRWLAFNIRSRIILPYLLLTMILAAIGTYVVTSLVTSSLDERLTNHLLEAGRVVSDTLVRHEMGHLEAARYVAFTKGFAEALQAGDQNRVSKLAEPAGFGQGIDYLIVVDAQGREILHTLRQDDDSLQRLEGEQIGARLSIVSTLLQTGDPDALPRRALGLHPINQRYYYLTAIPVSQDNDVIGVVVVGSLLEKLVNNFKATSLADVSIYQDGGRVIATSFALLEDVDTPIISSGEMAITVEQYETSLHGVDHTVGENIRIRGRWYRLARGPLQLGDTKLAVFSVALPAQFIVSEGVTSRNYYALLFAATMVGVVLVGYVVARRIIRPLGRLMSTSLAVANGDLEQRTGIKRLDEIGTLASTFDEMTGRLAERTHELEELLFAYKEAAGRMQAILSSIGDGVLLEDEGDVTPLNATAQALLEDMTTLLEFASFQEFFAKEQERAPDSQAGPWSSEMRRFPVGKKMLSVHSAAVQTEDGEHLGRVFVLRDVTVEVEAERLKDAFLAHVSHELRTPLTAVKGYLALLLADAAGSLGEQQRGFLETVDLHVENLVGMINMLLDFSEMEAGRYSGLHRRPCLLSETVKAVAQEWTRQMNDKGLDFQVESPVDLPEIKADEQRLRWAIINLVRNAYQCTPPGGQVMLKLSLQNGQVSIDVIDTGIGISLEDQQQLFTTFCRIAGREDQNRPGLGLGLYVTKAIVEAHDGEIKVSSEPGSGSTFSIILPISQESEVNGG